MHVGMAVSLYVANGNFIDVVSRIIHIMRYDDQDVIFAMRTLIGSLASVCLLITPFAFPGCVPTRFAPV